MGTAMTRDVPSIVAEKLALVADLVEAARALRDIIRSDDFDLRDGFAAAEHVVDVVDRMDAVGAAPFDES
jgi:hypothetical protein